MSVILVYVIGVKHVVPILTISMLFSHTARTLLNFQFVNKKALLLVVMPSIPATIAVAFVYGKISSPLIAIIMGFVVMTSVLFRRYSEKHSVPVSPKTMMFAGLGYGTLSGTSIGPGTLLPPFMLGFGLSRHQFVATLAVIALLSNVVRGLVYSADSLYSLQNVHLGILIGLITIPGNWIGRIVLRRLSNKLHAKVVDYLMVFAAFNFFVAGILETTK